MIIAYLCSFMCFAFRLSVAYQLLEVSGVGFQVSVRLRKG
jgi:hypothetical protein